jgi:hypothetical protein
VPRDEGVPVTVSGRLSNIAIPGAFNRVLTDFLDAL